MSRYVPPQHGAWAFLGLPLVLGALVAPASPLLLVLAVAWVAAYPWSYALLGAVRSRRPGRFRRPLIAWTAVVAPSALALVGWRPWLVWVGAGYVAAFAVHLAYARRNDERALGNDLVLVAECSAMVVVTWAVAAGPRAWRPPAPDAVPTSVWVLTVLCALVLTGSTLHVKSLIRERDDPRYARASVAFALVGVPVSVALAAWWGLPAGTWLVLPAGVMAVRAVVVPRLSWRPLRIGLVELALVVVTALAAGAAAG